MTTSDLELVLAYANSRLDAIRTGTTQLAADGRDQDARLDELERRLGVTIPPDAATGPARLTAAPGSTPATAWDAIVASSRLHFEQIGVDPGTVDLASYMDPVDVAELMRNSMSTTPFRCKLDMVDLVIATVAGLAAAAVDFTIVKVPKDMTFHDAKQAGSPLTTYLRGKAIPHNNRLAELAKVPFDSLNRGDPDLRLTPKTHRADTFGHDPLVGLVFGVIDILRGTSTGVASNGQAFIRDIGDPATTNPFAAIVLELAHLLSDIGTRSGLPLPGWSLLRLINAGSIDGQTVSNLARQMYLRGYDTWHLATMCVSVAAAETVLRAGWVIRSVVDNDWARRCDEDARVAGSTRTGTHPRFLLMALIAHGIATAANAGKIAIAGGNPLAWNAPQWGRFALVIHQWWTAQERSIADAITARSDINLEYLMTGWPSASQQAAPR